MAERYEAETQVGTEALVRVRLDYAEYPIRVVGAEVADPVTHVPYAPTSPLFLAGLKAALDDMERAGVGHYDQGRVELATELACKAKALRTYWGLRQVAAIRRKVKAKVQAC